MSEHERKSSRRRVELIAALLGILWCVFSLVMLGFAIYFQHAADRAKADLEQCKDLLVRIAERPCLTDHVKPVEPEP